MMLAVDADTRVRVGLLSSALVGLACGCVVVGLWTLLYGLSLTTYPPFDLADLVIRYSPGDLATWAIESFGSGAQRSLLASGVGAWLLVWGVLGVALRGGVARRVASGAGLALLLPALGLAWWSEAGLSVARLIWLALALGAPLALGGRLLAGWIVALQQYQRESATTTTDDWLSASGSATRRELVVQIGAAVLLVGAGGGFAGRLLRRAETGQVATAAGTPLALILVSEGPLDATGTPVALPTAAPTAQLRDDFAAPDGVDARLTPNDSFYVVDISTRDPRLPEDDWRLRVHGLVERQLELSYADLLGMPSIEQHGTLLCISYEHGSALISTTRWTGVPLREVLDRAGVRADAIELICRGAGGYSDSIPLDTALKPTTLLAYGMDGESLPTAHGFPCRLYVPGLYGEKNVKWLQEIELSPVDYFGYWQDRGWTDVAIINTISEIQIPREDPVLLAADGVVPVGGIAFAGTRGIAAVQLRVDDGDWQPAELEPYEPDLVWQRWRFDWRPAPGEYRLTVRATDGAGELQTDVRREPHPDGMTGWHSVDLSVR